MSARLGLVAALVLLPSVASAAFREVPRPTPLPALPDRVFTLSVQVEAAVGLSDEMQQVYHRGHPMAGSLRFAFWLHERLGVGLGVGYHRRAGLGVAPWGPKPTTALHQVPVQVEGGLRMALWERQVAVPVLRFGFDLVPWVERWRVEGGPEGESMGLRVGAHLGGGVQFRLPFPETSFRGGLTRPALLDDLYLHVDGWIRAADDFGRADVLDLGAAGVGVGLTFML